MPDLNDGAYYKARASQARALAEAAVDPAIAAIHRNMAVSYDELAERTDANERTGGPIRSRLDSAGPQR
jgi:hypothetical protein